MTVPTRRDARIVQILALLVLAVYFAASAAWAQRHPPADTRPHPDGSPAAFAERCQPQQGYPHHAIVTTPDGVTRFTANPGLIERAILQATTAQDFDLIVHEFCA